MPDRRLFVFLVLSLFFLKADHALASATYSRSPSGGSVTSPVAFSVTAASLSDLGIPDGDNYWGLTVLILDGEQIESSCVPTSTLSKIFSVSLPNHNYTHVGIISGDTLANCQNPNVQNSGADLEGPGGVIFTVISAQPSGGSIGSAAPVQYGPKVKVTRPEGGAFLSNNVEIKYEATDENDSSRQGADRLGLGENPVAIYYSDTLDALPEGKFIDEADKILITEKQPASGSFFWDTSSLPDGDNYRVVAEAKDKFGDKGEAASQKFFIDRTPPVFNVSAEPAFTRGEDVKITVEPSEELSEPPFVEAKQREFALRQILMARVGTSTNWAGTYQIVSGFDGPAEIFVSGKDKAGNKGNVIAKGGRFSVGVEPPPKPIIISPLDKDIVSSDTVTIRGKAREDTTVVLLVNSKDEYKTKPDSERNFIFENIKLNAELQKGINFLSVTSKDATGNISESAGFSVKFNLGPDLKIISPVAGEALTGSSTIRISASDRNGDRLFFTYEVSRDGGKNWILLAGNIASKAYLWPTFNFPDGEYLLRAQAYDGTIKTEATSSPFKVANFLPIISFPDGERAVSGSPNPTVKGRVLSPERIAGEAKANIFSLEYSLDGGATWSGAAAEDGFFNSPDENFVINFQNFKEGLYKILLRAKDSRGLLGRASKTLIVDFGPPPAPILSEVQPPIIGDADDIDPNAAGVQVALIGKSEPESMVNAVLGGNVYSIKTNSAGEFSVRVTLRNHGKNDFTLFATDLADNKSAETKVSLIYNNPPELKILSPREGKGLNHKAEISWEAADPDGDSVASVVLGFRKGAGEFKRLVSNPRTAKFVWDVSGLRAGGDYELKLEAGDGVSVSEERRRFFVDNISPQIKLEPLEKTSFNKSFVLTVSGNASDDFSGVEFVEYSIDGQHWFKAVLTSGFLEKSARFSLKHPFLLEDGEYVLRVRAVDASGNLSSEAGQKIVVDTIPPRAGSFTLSYGAMNLLPEGESIKALRGVKLKFALSLESDAVFANINFGKEKLNLVKNNSTNLWETDISPAQTGTSTLLLSAEDFLGNRLQNKEIGRIEAVENGRALPSGTKLTVFIRNPEDGSLAVWRADAYGEENPVISDELGHYALLLPSGKYQILAEKIGFERLRFSDFEILNPKFINFDFELSPRRGLRGALEDLLEKISF